LPARNLQKTLSMKTESDKSNHDHSTGKQSWFERNVNLIIVGLVIACVATLVAQAICGPVFGKPFFYEGHEAHFPPEKWFGFQAIFGFVAFVTVVMLGRLLRPLVRREEDYYDS